MKTEVRLGKETNATQIEFQELVRRAGLDLLVFCEPYHNGDDSCLRLVDTSGTRVTRPESGNSAGPLLAANQGSSGFGHRPEFGKEASTCRHRVNP